MATINTEEVLSQYSAEGVLPLFNKALISGSIVCMLIVSRSSGAITGLLKGTVCTVVCFTVSEKSVK